MPRARKWMGRLLLRSPASVRSLRRVPILGDWIHGLSHRLVRADEKLWAQVEAGPAQGLWLELNPRTGHDYLLGRTEPAMAAILAQRLRPGMVFYDLGANIGLFSLLAARLVGPGGRVFSFEPDAGVAARLRRNIARNEFANVSVVEAGVWSSSGSVNFLASGSASPDQGTGRFVPADVSPSATAAPCVALDDFIQSAPPPDAIKCDVEGAEVEVLRGMETMLQSRRPWILCEMHSQENDHAFRARLARFVYTFTPVDQNHILASP